MEPSIQDLAKEEVSPYLKEELPTDWKAQFQYGMSILIYTYTPIQGMLDANWASYERKKNISDLHQLFDCSKYRFDKMSTEELVQVMIKELVKFVADS